MSNYSDIERSAVLRHAHGEALGHAIAGFLFWLLTIFIGLFGDEVTILHKLFAAALFAGIGYVIGFFKGLTKGITIVDEERVRRAAGR